MRFNSGESVHLRGQSRCKKIATGWISFLSVYLVANKNHFLSKVSIFSSLPTQFIVTIYTETSKEGWITDLEGSFSSEWPFLIPRTFFMGHKNAIFSSLQEIISLHTTRLFNILCFQTLFPPLPPHSRCPWVPGATTPSEWSPGTRLETVFPQVTPRCVSLLKMFHTRTRTMWWVEDTLPTTWSSPGR